MLNNLRTYITSPPTSSAQKRANNSSTTQPSSHGAPNTAKKSSKKVAVLSVDVALEQAFGQPTTNDQNLFVFGGNGAIKLAQASRLPRPAAVAPPYIPSEPTFVFRRARPQSEVSPYSGEHPLNARTPEHNRSRENGSSGSSSRSPLDRLRGKYSPENAAISPHSGHGLAGQLGNDDEVFRLRPRRNRTVVLQSDPSISPDEDARRQRVVKETLEHMDQSSKESRDQPKNYTVSPTFTERLRAMTVAQGPDTELPKPRPVNSNPIRSEPVLPREQSPLLKVSRPRRVSELPATSRASNGEIKPPRSYTLEGEDHLGSVTEQRRKSAADNSSNIRGSNIAQSRQGNVTVEHRGNQGAMSGTEDGLLHPITEEKESNVSEGKGVKEHQARSHSSGVTENEVFASKSAEVFAPRKTFSAVQNHVPVIDGNESPFELMTKRIALAKAGGAVNAPDRMHHLKHQARTVKTGNGEMTASGGPSETASRANDATLEATGSMMPKNETTSTRKTKNVPGSGLQPTLQGTDIREGKSSKSETNPSNDAVLLLRRQGNQKKKASVVQQHATASSSESSYSTRMSVPSSARRKPALPVEAMPRLAKRRTSSTEEGPLNELREPSVLHPVHSRINVLASADPSDDQGMQKRTSESAEERPIPPPVVETTAAEFQQSTPSPVRQYRKATLVAKNDINLPEPDRRILVDETSDARPRINPESINLTESNRDASMEQGSIPIMPLRMSYSLKQSKQAQTESSSEPEVAAEKELRQAASREASPSMSPMRKSNRTPVYQATLSPETPQQPDKPDQNVDLKIDLFLERESRSTSADTSSQPSRQDSPRSQPLRGPSSPVPAPPRRPSPRGKSLMMRLPSPTRSPPSNGVYTSQHSNVRLSPKPPTSPPKSLQQQSAVQHGAEQELSSDSFDSLEPSDSPPRAPEKRDAREKQSSETYVAKSPFEAAMFSDTKKSERSPRSPVMAKSVEVPNDANQSQDQNGPRSTPSPAQSIKRDPGSADSPRSNQSRRSVDLSPSSQTTVKSARSALDAAKSSPDSVQSASVTEEKQTRSFIEERSVPISAVRTALESLGELRSPSTANLSTRKSLVAERQGSAEDGSNAESSKAPGDNKPRRAESERSLAMRVRESVDAKRAEEALMLCDEWKRLNPRACEAWFLSGRAHLLKGDVSQSEQHLANALRLATQEHDESIRQGAAREMTKLKTMTNARDRSLEDLTKRNGASALSHASRAREIAPLNAQLCVLRAAALLVAAVSPSAPMDFAATVEGQSSGHKDMEKELDLAFMLSSDFVSQIGRPAAQYARVIHRSGLSQEADVLLEETCNRVRGEVPQLPMCVDLLRLFRSMEGAKADANDAFRRGRYPEAIRLYSKALELDPVNDIFNAILLSNRAACHVSMNEFARAVVDCDAALKLVPTFLRARIRRARALMKMNKYREAVSDLELAMRVNPSSELADELASARKAMKEHTSRSSFGRHMFSEGDFGIPRSQGLPRPGPLPNHMRRPAQPTIPPEDDLYYILGVGPTASNADIKKAYHRAALKHHPDKNRGDEHANQRFKRVLDAFHTLSDPILRRKYDLKANSLSVPMI